MTTAPPVCLPVDPLGCALPLPRGPSFAVDTPFGPVTLPDPAELSVHDLDLDEWPSCPLCTGTGAVADGSRCPACGGIGVRCPLPAAGSPRPAVAR